MEGTSNPRQNLLNTDSSLIRKLHAPSGRRITNEAMSENNFVQAVHRCPKCKKVFIQNAGYEKLVIDGQLNMRIKYACDNIECRYEPTF